MSDNDLLAAVTAVAPGVNWQVVSTVSATGCVVAVYLGDGTNVRREAATRLEAESSAAQTVRELATPIGFEDDEDLVTKLEASIAVARSKRPRLRLIKGGRS
jgi:hypothetical protein